jgi:hypothetical protein
VLLQGIGKAVVVEDVTDAEVLAAIASIYPTGRKTGGRA